VFPYRVDNPRLGRAVITGLIIVLNLLGWVLVEGMGAEAVLTQAICAFGLIPSAVLGHLPPGTTLILGDGISCTVGAVPRWLTPLTSMFMHGGWFHLLGNMWFLWLFGRNVEDVMGRGRYAVFYVLVGGVAAAAQVLADPTSRLPMVGASGAVSGIMGAYVVLFPTVRVHLWVVLGIFLTRVALPAYVMLGYWFVLQLLGSSVSALQAHGGGVAFTAHVGGFLAGAALVSMFKDRSRWARREALSSFMG
jgi:membrane associated rhomboid family serine protease